MKKKTVALCWMMAVLLAVFAYTPVKNYIEWINKPDEMDGTGLRAVKYESIDQIMDSTKTVVLAELTEIAPSDIVEYRMTYKIKETLYGTCPFEEIITYEGHEEKEQMTVGQDYLIFASPYDVYAYPDNAYAMRLHDTFYAVKNDRLIGPSKLGDSLLRSEYDTLSEMREYLKTIPSPYSEDDILANSFATVKEMYDASDIVAKVKIAYRKSENERVDFIKISEAHSIKGEALSKDIGYLWPAYEKIEEGREYYVFLDKDFLPISREGAVIGEDEKEWADCAELSSK